MMHVVYSSPGQANPSAPCIVTPIIALAKTSGRNPLPPFLLRKARYLMKKLEAEDGTLSVTLD
eukprot:scaffold332890_cov34-Prasinocladus_malaysianus.AAC.1